MQLKNIIDFKNSFCPAGFSFKRIDNRVLYLRIFFFDEGAVTPKIESNIADEDLHIKATY